MRCYCFPSGIGQILWMGVIKCKKIIHCLPFCGYYKLLSEFLSGVSINDILLSYFCFNAAVSSSTGYHIRNTHVYSIHRIRLASKNK